jgi:hypothetical protein
MAAYYDTVTFRRRAGLGHPFFPERVRGTRSRP